MTDDKTSGAVADGPNSAVEAPSYEYSRRVGRQVNKFELDLATVGVRYALQQHRAIGSLHTFYPGQRAELDYTKYLIWAYPTANWNEPILWHTGIGIDHASGVIKGYTITAQPSAATGIRLYKRCVLPKRLWLPVRLRGYANEWDVAGLDHLVAIDNAMDLQSDSMTTTFMVYGVIVLCMPRRRGDLKGRCHRSA